MTIGHILLITANLGLILLLLSLVLLLYFLPYVVAAARGVPERIRLGVLLVNLFLGLTVLGWVGALVWATSAKSLKGED